MTNEQRPKEKYLTVSILGNIRVNCYNNKEEKAKNQNAPDFKGNGVAIWINTKKDEPQKPKEESII